MTTDLSIIDSYIAAEQPAAAVARLRELLYRAPNVVSARAVIDRFEPKGRLSAGQACKVWFLRSFTIEPVFPLIRAAALLEGLDLEIRAGDFNTYVQEILDPDSAMYAFGPDVVLLTTQARDLLPALFEKTASGTSEDLSQIANRATSELCDWLRILRSRSNAVIIVADFSPPAATPGGMLGAQAEVDAADLVLSVNRALREALQPLAGAYVLPMSRVVRRMGEERFYDERKWLMARLPFSAEAVWPIAQACIRVLLPAMGKVRKAIVVDLDNTMWGGVVGEDGPSGLKLSDEYPGAAFKAFQRALLECHERGVILAIASKNNEQDAMEVLDGHPEMVLKPSHFAAKQINWNSKPENLRHIAKALNIGTDALVFIDDNPAERAQMREQLPEVLVVELPADPMGYAAAVRDLPVLERLRVSSEDRDRGRQYDEQRQRDELHRASGSMEGFYRSLEMRVTIRPISPLTLARASQLTQKTNQFNLTTRRYDEARVAAMLGDATWRTYACSVRDRFGDNGLVGIALVKVTDENWVIDTFLLSCRVIGRTVETGMLARIAADADAAGSKRLTGEFIPTLKNAPARDFYESHGFVRRRESQDDNVWELELGDSQPRWPEWLGDLSEGDSA